MSTGAYDVLSEHQHIRRLVDALELSLEKRTSGGRAWLDEVVPALAELATDLASHFKGEEAEFFADVSKRIPRHAPVVQRLSQQHLRLSKDFGEVANQANSLDPFHAKSVEDFVAVLSAALKQLRAHEEQENELMLVAYWQDLGEVD
jgi:hemerythrin